MNMRIRFVTVGVLFAVMALFVHTHASVSVPMNKPFTEYPLVVGEWRMSNQSIFSQAILDVLKPTDYLAREYTGADGAKVYLYVGYHNGGPDAGPIHSPKNCLPGSGWFRVSESVEALTVDGVKFNVVRALYQKGDAKDLFLYWFQVRDRALTDEYALKIAETMNSLTDRRRDSSFVRISVRFDREEEKAYAAGVRFIATHRPLLMQFLPK